MIFLDISHIQTERVDQLANNSTTLDKSTPHIPHISYMESPLENAMELLEIYNHT